MPTNVKTDRLYDTLFELSNDIRHNILLLVLEKPIRMTSIAQTLGLTSPEVSRHLSRLSEAKLLQKDINNFYRVTDYGQHCLSLIDSLSFFTRNREYFVSHNSQGIPYIFRNRLTELTKYDTIDNFMEFIHFINERIKKSKEFVWLYIDQYPILAIESILKSVENGVKFRIIEQGDLFGPNIAFEHKNLMYKGEKGPDVEIKINNFSGVYLFVSDSGSAVAFPTDSGFDYSGFVINDSEDFQWSIDLFEHYWSNSALKSEIPLTQHTISTQSKGKVIIIQASADPFLNYHAIQDAINNYDEVILNGKFNIGTSCINVSKSVIIRGEERENDTPLTSIYKKKWMFPFQEFDSIFKIDGKNANITIENISFTDFNHTCIWGEEFNNLIVKKNRISLISGAGRGLSLGGYGDTIIGIWVRGARNRKVAGEVIVEDNLIDFATGGFYGETSRSGAEDLMYQSVSLNHEYFMSFGISIENITKKVRISNNIIRNTNARGMSIIDSSSETDLKIEENNIASYVPGSYPFRGLEAGVGIHIHSSEKEKAHSFKVWGNRILMEKPDYCGIVTTGFNTSREDPSEKVLSITENTIHLIDGQACIKTDSENIEVSKNEMIGNAFFGIVKTVNGVLENFCSNKSNELKTINKFDRLKLEDPSFWVSRRRPS